VSIAQIKGKSWMAGMALMRVSRNESQCNRNAPLYVTVGFALGATRS
jgi:hypothetical protein